MFQDFSDQSESRLTPARIASLRDRLQQLGVDGFIVPRADQFQGEYVPPSAERLKWLTGFSGSAGTAVILADKAAIFVDGRYTLQVREQVDLSLLTPLPVPDETPHGWAAANMPKGAKLAYDPWLLTVQAASDFASALEAKGAKLLPLPANPIDEIWAGRPAAPSGPVQLQPLQFAGQSSADKLSAIAKGLKDRAADAHILTQTDAVAWAFNIRGSDIPHVPAALAFAIVHADGTADLLLGPSRVPEDVRDALGKRVRLHAPDAMSDRLRALGEAKATVELDRNWAADAFRLQLEEAGASLKWHDSPCTLPRATKNRAELEGARAAHLRDGVPMARFLRWLAEEAPSGKLDEITAAKKLEALRVETGELHDLSFDSISGAGPHAAIHITACRKPPACPSRPTRST